MTTVTNQVPKIPRRDNNENKSVYNFRCNNHIIGSDTVPFISASESMLQQFTSYHQELIDSGQNI